jgi:hypothetical protein
VLFGKIGRSERRRLGLDIGDLIHLGSPVLVRF